MSQGMEMCKSGNILEGVRLLVLGNALEEACHFVSAHCEQSLKSNLGGLQDSVKLLEML